MSRQTAKTYNGFAKLSPSDQVAAYPGTKGFSPAVACSSIDFELAGPDLKVIPLPEEVRAAILKSLKEGLLKNQGFLPDARLLKGLDLDLKRTTQVLNILQGVFPTFTDVVPAPSAEEKKGGAVNALYKALRSTVLPDTEEFKEFLGKLSPNTVKFLDNPQGAMIPPDAFFALLLRAAGFDSEPSALRSAAKQIYANILKLLKDLNQTIVLKKGKKGLYVLKIMTFHSKKERETHKNNSRTTPSPAAPLSALPLSATPSAMSDSPRSLRPPSSMSAASAASEPAMSPEERNRAINYAYTPDETLRRPSSQDDQFNLDSYGALQMSLGLFFQSHFVPILKKDQNDAGIRMLMEKSLNIKIFLELYEICGLHFAHLVRVWNLYYLISAIGCIKDPQHGIRAVIGHLNFQKYRFPDLNPMVALANAFNDINLAIEEAADLGEPIDLWKLYCEKAREIYGLWTGISAADIPLKKLAEVPKLRYNCTCLFQQITDFNAYIRKIQEEAGLFQQVQQVQQVQQGQDEDEPIVRFGVSGAEVTEI